MASISSLSNWQPAAARIAPAGTGLSNSYGAPTAAPSAIVRLSPESQAAASLADAATAPAIAPAAVRFKGMGAAMLRQFDTGAAVPVTQAALPDTVDNKFTLGIVTRSGVKVDLTLASLDDGMAFEASASGELSDAERKALSSLAMGFQAAIDGMAMDDPQVRIGMLQGFDSTALQSVDFHAEVKQAALPPATQTLDFHADGHQRKVSLDGPSGHADVAVDTGKLASLGTRSQQAKAINSYLKQFDQAAGRGHGDAKLMTMFKDAFSDMSRTAVRDTPRDTGLSLPGQWQLADEDHAALTGLADFSASVTQAPAWSNPLRASEKDSFSYTVSQQTRIDGERRDDRTVSQTQQARLTAQFHAPLKRGGALQLDVTPQSQNYEYHRIDDTADANVELGYRDGHLVKAALQQSASQSERVQTYILGKLASDRTTPASQALVRDLMASLQPYQAGSGKADDTDDTGDAREGRRQAALTSRSDNMLLLASPAELALRNQRM